MLATHEEFSSKRKDTRVPGKKPLGQMPNAVRLYLDVRAQSPLTAHRDQPHPLPPSDDSAAAPSMFPTPSGHLRQIVC